MVLVLGDGAWKGFHSGEAPPCNPWPELVLGWNPSRSAEPSAISAASLFLLPWDLANLTALCWSLRTQLSSIPTLGEELEPPKKKT